MGGDFGDAGLTKDVLTIFQEQGVLALKNLEADSTLDPVIVLIYDTTKFVEELLSNLRIDCCIFR